MDDTEILSDCSELSKNSECLSTNTSALSGLSEYQGEFLELRGLINPDKFLKVSKTNSTVPKEKVVVSLYEERIQNINTQLQNALKQNEKYKNEIYDLEKKKDLSSNEKIENLLKQNNQLETNLAAANNQIQRLIRIYNVKDNQDESALLEHKILQLEKCNQELNLQNCLLSNEINHFNYHKNENEIECKQLKIEINELKLELAVKVNCIAELKDKISKQHVEFQSILQNNVKLSHSLDSLSNELQYVKKSESWYRHELHRLQKDKFNLREEIVESNKKVAFQEKELEHLKLQLNNWKCSCDEMSLKALQERECLLKQTETENKQIISTVNENVNGKDDIDRITAYYEAAIHDLTNDVSRIRSNFENQQSSLAKITKENSDLLAKYLLLQSCFKEKEWENEKLENTIKDLKIKLATAIDQAKDYDAKVLNLTNQISGLEIELSLKNQEKQNVEESVKALKEQFKIFKSNYDSVKTEVNLKNKEILQLQCDKQKLYMHFNWKTCELEKAEQKSIGISKLQEKLNVLVKNEGDLKLENSKQMKEIESLNKKVAELEAKLKDLQSYNSNMIFNYDRTITENNDKINELTMLLVEKEGSIFKLEQKLAELREELDKHDKKVEIDMLDKQMTKNKDFSNDQYKMQKDVTNFVVNNCANFVSVDSINVVDILEYVCKLCKVDDIVKVSHQHSVSSDNKSEYIKTLLNQIDKYFQLIDNETVSQADTPINLKRKVFRLKKYVVNRIDKLEGRFKTLEDKNQENASLLLKLLSQDNQTQSNWNEEVKHLHALLQVKTREQKEKQKKYETNYRTLLRKVKEHMKGRNVAEKHNIYLQELQNNLSDERNTLKLHLDLKESEIKRLENHMENYININEKLKLSIVKLESEQSKGSQCESCLDIEIVKKHERELEESLKNCEHSKIACLNELKLKEEMIAALKKENQELMFNISVVNAEHNADISKMEELMETVKQLRAQFNNFENELSQEKAIKAQLSVELSEEKDNHLKICSERDNLNKIIEEVTAKNTYLLKEVEYINASLERKSIELKELQLQHEQVENNWCVKDAAMQNLMAALKSQLQAFKNEIDRINNQKFFLQRLCTDLKVALQVHVNHNKVLKEYVNNLCKEKEEYESLSITLSNFPSPAKYDDMYINKLLQENKAPVQDKPLSDIQGCLDTLRKEILVLQKEIVQKNNC